MRLWFILFFCLCLVACGRMTRMHNNDNSPESVDDKSETTSANTGEEYIDGDSNVSTVLVGGYYRLLEIIPHVNKQRYCTFSGFFYWFFASEPFYAIGLAYKARKIPDDESQLLRVQHEEDGSHIFYHPDFSVSDDVLVNRFDKIDIVSNADFNDIPAGQSLASKFEFFSTSAWPIFRKDPDMICTEGSGHYNKVISSYLDTDFGKKFHNYPFNDFFKPVHKDISELTSDDLYLLSAELHAQNRMSACLVAKEVPEIKEHIFTISYYEGDKVWSVDIPAVFEPYIPEAYREKYGL